MPYASSITHKRALEGDAPQNGTWFPGSDPTHGGWTGSDSARHSREP